MSKKQEKPIENQLPPEEQDLPQRLEGFNKELSPLLGKYELAIMALPKILPDGRTVADPMVVSARKPKPAEQQAKTLANPEV